MSLNPTNVQVKKSRLHRLDAYLVAGVGVAGMASTANAAVVSIDMTPYAAVNGGAAAGGQTNIGDFTGAGSGRIVISNGYAGGGILIRGLMFQDSTGTGGFAKGGGFPYSPVIFSAGQTIDSTSAANGFSDGYFANFFAGGFLGGAKPSIGAGSFMGFRDNYGRFGYIEVTWDNTTSEFYILSAAYESVAGVGITTPSGGGAVPEPTSGAVVALLMGGTALRQWRKKKRDAQESNSENLAS